MNIPELQNTLHADRSLTPERRTWRRQEIQRLAQAEVRALVTPDGEIFFQLQRVPYVRSSLGLRS